MIGAEAHELFRDLIDRHDSWVLTTHINPDGDAIGSQYAMARFLRSRSKQVRIINNDPTPDVLRFIVDESVPLDVYDAKIHDSIFRDVDAVLLLDNSAPDRLGRMEPVMRSAAERTLCIDHHPTRNAPWAHNILDVRACATAVLVYELTRHMGWEPDEEAARSIYVGLATDTGFFRFNSMNPRAHEVAADLMRRGVRSARIFGAVYERNPWEYVRLLGHALAGLRSDGNGAVASVRITRQMVQDLGAEDVDTSEINTVLLAIDGVRVVLLFRELSGDRVKVSLRSKGSLDVHRLAAEFGGGGHRNASGIVTPGTLDEISEAVITRAVALSAAETDSP